MQVTDVTTFVIRNPPPSFDAAEFIVVRVTTGDGVVGWGEMASGVVGPGAATAVVADISDRFLIGEDPRQIEGLWRRLRSSSPGGMVDSSTIGVVSGLEIACWDIVGKAAGRPIHELLGGRAHDDLRAATALYPSAGWREVRTNAEHAAARASNEVERGFSALMFDVVGSSTGIESEMPSQGGLADTAQMIATIRSSIGPGADLVVRAHGRFAAAGATRLVHELEAFDPLWLDHPCPDDRPDALASVAASSSTPVAAGSTVTTLAGFASLHRSASVWRPDIGRCGGLLAGRKIAAVAEAHGIVVAPVLGGGPILGAAIVQLALSMPNVVFVEGVREWGGIHADLLTTPVEWCDGRVAAPDGPGLGTDLDVDVARQHVLVPADATPLPPPPA